MNVQTPPFLDSAEPAARRLLTALFIGVFMSALDTAVIAPAIPALRVAFGVDNRQISLVTVIFVLGSMPSTALMAALGDRHGRRPVYLACVAAFAAGSLLIAASTSFTMILAGRAIQGIGAGGEGGNARQVDGAAPMAVAQRGHQRGAGHRTQDEDDGDQADLAVVHAEGGAQRRDGRGDDGGVERRHEDADEQRC